MLDEVDMQKERFLAFGEMPFHGEKAPVQARRAETFHGTAETGLVVRPQGADCDTPSVPQQFRGCIILCLRHASCTVVGFYATVFGRGATPRDHGFSILHFRHDVKNTVSSASRRSIMTFKIKRVYEPAAPSDGVRVLVDRLWPRGVSKSKAHLDHWMKDIAPSAKLRLWFGHRPERFAEFKTRYAKEIDGNPKLAELHRLGKGAVVTLLYGARDPEMNQAAVLQSLLKSGARKRRPAGSAAKRQTKQSA
jgi:uncharacterized protein YeaO (DUF488 family)